jgi:hypothetical protein
MHPKRVLIELRTAPHRTKMVTLSMFTIPFDWKQLAIPIEIQLLFLG